MLVTLLQMFALIGAGLLWAWFNPARLDATHIRRVITDLVYFLFLPALVLKVLWLAPLGADSLHIAAVAAAGVLGMLGAGLLLCRLCRVQRPVAGAVLLASAFPNATYLGYPLLISLYGERGGTVAIQYDLFACTPLLLSVGILLAARYGDRGERPHPLWMLVRVPPIWAALAAVAFNLSDLPAPEWLIGLLGMMGSAVVPLMLIAVGLALVRGFAELSHAGSILPVVVLKLALQPLLVWGMALLLGMTGELRTAVVLEAAMPSMVLGIVLCDRYGLNTGIYAAAVTLTTLLSILTLPLWYGWA
ncbi:AEC family transporter [Thiohalobacter sp. IOR34]|uniref:AEC family transporter n=1 Tax=Thiohalobacter sp. IOR34 TaxID=3057176 RepID=UPI0025AF6C8C|nr:AEC family transporter [Thiohalobacter sp. IOR34]WJW76591.1 AEC family transporter [Thiohalobacter sp. IOR34]